MKNIARPLIKDEQIVSFLDAIDFRTYFSDHENSKRIFSGMNDVNAMMATAITLIREANQDLLKVVSNNTLTSNEYRAYPFVTDSEREDLRKMIFDELKSTVRPKNDDDICLGNGGMLPISGIVNRDRKAIIIIGLPASGKSGIAAKVSDFFNAVLIDSDFVKRKIPEFRKTNGASLVHDESKIIKDNILSAAINDDVNFVLPIIGSEYESVVSTISSIKRHRYNVSLILVELDRIKATQRAFSRFVETKRYVPLSRILDDYANNPSLVFYKLLANKRFPDLPVALINTDVPFGEKPQIVIQRRFSQIHKII